MSELVQVERRDHGVAVVRLDNPKVNALSGALLGELGDAAQRLTADPPGAVVITGGDRIFAAGADISEFAGPAEAHEIGAAFHRALDAVAAIPRFVIAVVSGTRSAEGASSPWPATTGSPVRRRCSDSPRRRSGSSPAAAAPSASAPWWGRAEPRP